MCWTENERLLLRGCYDPAPHPILAQLAETPALQRLALVGMNCGCEYTAFPRFSRGRAYSRYVHSLGVGAIVWHFTRDAKQAAAGLLHDIATPAFAHVVDFLNGDHLTQSSTEDGTRERIAQSPEIQSVLAAWGLCTDDVADYHRYPIADNDSPRLSADRLEYTLGNALNYGFAELATLRALYADLAVGQNEEGRPELVFRTPACAADFGRLALRCAKVYVSPEDRCAMQALAELLARAIDQGILSRADLDTTEPQIISALQQSALSSPWAEFCRLGRVETAPAPPDERPWRQIRAKKRYIDPFTPSFGRLSRWDPAFARDLSAYLAASQSEYVLAEPSD